MRAVFVSQTSRGTVSRVAGFVLSIHVLGILGAVSPGCSTDAVAIQQCREIESVRCEGSASCGIIDTDDIESCKRFYQDQCLHGIAGDKEPSAE